MSENFESIIERLIGVGIRAPSGDNCQPWRFEIRDKVIYLHLLHDRDHSLYSSGQRPSYVAHGAVIENMIIAATHLGYTLRVSLFPDPGNPYMVARMDVERAEPLAQELYPSIPMRATNRKPYSAVPLEEGQRRALLQSVTDLGKGQVHFVEEKGKKRELASIAASNERLLFENKHLHRFFFDHVLWTQKDAEQQIGFSVKTFEFLPPQEKMFRLFRSWRFVRVASIFGASRFIAKQNAVLYNTAPVIGALVIDEDTPEAFVYAGRLMERVWLRATVLGLSFQPLTGIAFLHRRVREHDIALFSKEQVQYIDDQYQKMKNIFGLQSQKVIVMMFRIGVSDPPSARTGRLSPQITTRGIA